jgi:hypothetical protein
MFSVETACAVPELEGRLGQLEVPDDLLALDGDQDPTEVEVGIAPRRGVLRKLEHGRRCALEPA